MSSKHKHSPDRRRVAVISLTPPNRFRIPRLCPHCNMTLLYFSLCQKRPFFQKSALSPFDSWPTTILLCCMTKETGSYLLVQLRIVFKVIPFSNQKDPIPFLMPSPARSLQSRSQRCRLSQERKIKVFAVSLLSYLPIFRTME